MIAHDYWRTHFGAAPSAIGSRLRINGQSIVIVGVAPPRFQGTTLGLAFDLWLPATMAPVLVEGSRELIDRGQRGYTVLGRLNEGVTPAAANQELDVLLRDLATTHPDTDGGVRAELHAFTDPPRGPQRMINGALALLQGLMLLVLAAVCGNVANLLLARASVRQHDFGVRLAMGAPRIRIARIVLLEALLLAAAGTAIGVALALWGTQAVRAGEISGAMPIRFQTSIDGVGLAVAIGLGVLGAALAAATPAWLLTRMDPQEALRTAVRRASRSGLRETLMGIQVALALLVLVIAGLFFQRFQEGRGLDPGFKADGVLLAAYDRTGQDTAPGPQSSLRDARAGGAARHPRCRGGRARLLRPPRHPRPAVAQFRPGRPRRRRHAGARPLQRGHAGLPGDDGHPPRRGIGLRRRSTTSRRRRRPSSTRPSSRDTRPARRWSAGG